MGRKIIHLTAIIILSFLASGCASFELHIKENSLEVKPSTILIGHFVMRNMSYDPYAADEFRDALKYEFFIRGYNVKAISAGEQKPVNQGGSAVKACIEYSGDILVEGVISQRESGFLADRVTDTLISFTIYSKDGIILGEGFYYDKKSAGEESLRRDAADEFVSELMKNLD